VGESQTVVRKDFEPWKREIYLEAICECASPSRRSLTCAPALYTEPLKDKAIRRWNCEGRGWGAQSLTVSVLWKYLGYILVV